MITYVYLLVFSANMQMCEKQLAFVDETCNEGIKTVVRGRIAPR